jgi:hypothetical protein
MLLAAQVISRREIHLKERIMKRPVGRPVLYRQIIEDLDDAILYSPATIARLIEPVWTMYKRKKRDTFELVRQRLRITMGRLRHNHRFPREGDGFLKIKGQPPMPAHFGWRWKEAYLDKKADLVNW